MASPRKRGARRWRGRLTRTHGLPKPREARTRSFISLQRHWYAKLRRLGFRDIENGRDPNCEKTYYMGKRVSRILHFSRAHGDEDDATEPMLAHNARTFGTYTNVADTPTARAWRSLSKAAHDLPVTYKKRSFLIDLTQVGCIASYLLRRHRLTWGHAYWTWRRFLEDVGARGYQGLLVRGPSVEAR